MICRKNSFYKLDLVRKSRGYIKQASFILDTDEWQFLSEVFVADKEYSSIKVAYVYCKNVNMAFMEGLSLYREEFGQSYDYDEDNNLISAVDN